MSTVLPVTITFLIYYGVIVIHINQLNVYRGTKKKAPIGLRLFIFFLSFGVLLRIFPGGLNEELPGEYIFFFTLLTYGYVTVLDSVVGLLGFSMTEFSGRVIYWDWNKPAAFQKPIEPMWKSN